ncbi:hypothetical protein BDN72DRAFT_843231 [Pluteus cervinus]|uniref:Uncharacterized protein n=1 Tax=Pluteus cervinus TaxID=181527 RepID=A0ACD3AP42_9AGAR|nr:hypothetical protein BDN72DRAFT_843231 [Pluteus cervinus]
MVNSKFIALTAALFVSSALAVNMPVTLLMPRHAPQGDSRTIPNLLRHYPGARGPGISGRGNCDVGSLACADSDGCCPVGEYCGQWNGKVGCCPNGKNCRPNDDPCEYQGHVLCPNETFCCEPDATCFREPDGTPRCSKGPSPRGSAFVSNNDGGSAGSTGNSTGSTRSTSSSTGATTGPSGLSGSSGSSGLSGSSGSSSASWNAGVNALLAIGGFAVQAMLLT